MSILRSKHSGWTWEGRRTPFGGSGGGGGAPTQTTTYSTNIPEYARPYVENMLQSTQAQIYNQDMTGFRPYQPYSSDVNNYFAGFSPLQQQAQQSAYYMTTPGQFGLGTGLAGAAGIGGLSAAEQAGTLGQQALGYGAAGAQYGGAGAQYGAAGAEQANLAAQQAARQASMYGRMGAQAGRLGQQYGALGAGIGAGAQQFGLSAADLATAQGLGYGALGAGLGAQAAGLAPAAQQYGATSADVGMGGLGYGAMGAGFGAQAAGLSPAAQAVGREAAQIGAAGGAGAQALAEQVARQATGYGGQLARSGRLGLRAGEEMGAIGGQGLGYGALGAGYGAQAAGLSPIAQEVGTTAADIGAGGIGYGALGAGLGARGAQAAEQGFGAGEAFARQATDPYAVAQYMSPYMQNVVDYQKSQALRDFGIGQGLRRAQAVGAGAFGGSRQAIAESEAERALTSQLQGIEATGRQKAFEDAQRQQQFGANLGLQGLGAGYQGLGVGLQGTQAGLAGLGTALQGQQARLGALGQAGQFLGQGIQGTQAGLAGLGTALQGQQGRLAGLSAYQQGLQAAQSGLGQALGAGQLGLQGTQQALAGQQANLAALGQAGQFLGQGMQGAQVGMAGISPALQGLQGAQAGLGQAGQLYGLGMQGAGYGLQGLQGALAGTAQGLQGYQAGMQGAGMGLQGASSAMQGAGVGLQGVGQQLGAGQLGLQGTAQGIQGAQAGMQGAGMGLQGVGQAVGAGQLGLGGLSAATQAAGTLGQLGGAQFGTEKDIIGLQSQMGAQQQQLEQAKINQAIQDYAIAQQYPFMQLGLMNAMLRGLPLQTQTTQLYQAQPTSLQQGIGLLGAGASLFGRKEGGVIKMAEGGIANAYKYGGAIPEPKLESMADRLSIDQLQERLRDPALTPGERRVFAEALQEKMRARESGIAAAGGPAFEGLSMAGGGIVAFAGEGPSLVEEEPIDPETGLPYKSVNPIARFGQFMNPFSGPGSLGSIARGGKSIEETYDRPRNVSADDRTRQAQAEAQDMQEGPGVIQTAAKKEEKQTGTKGTAAAQAAEDKAAGQGANSFAKFLAEIKGAGPKGQIGAEYEKFLDERLGKSAERLSRDERMAMAKGFLKFASTPAPGGIGQAAAAGLTEYATGVEAARKAQDTMENEAQKARMELDKARRAEERGDVAAAREAYDKYEDRMNRIKTSQISAGAAGQAGRFEKEAVERVMAENPGMKFADALQVVRGAGRFESTEAKKAEVALNDINQALLTMSKKDPRRAELEAQRQRILQMLTPGGGIGGGQVGGGQSPGILRFDAQGNLIKG